MAAIVSTCYWYSDKKTYQEAELPEAPRHCSLMMRQVTARVRHLDNRTEDSRGRQTDTEDREGEWRIAADMNNGTSWQEQPKPAHEQWQQTCVMNARRDTIASGSCCCSPLVGSRSLVDYRTESLAATAHSMAVRHG